MMRALWTASTGMMAQQLNVDTISNNIANVNSMAYKKSRAEFKDLLYETLEKGMIKDGQGKPVNVQVGHGVKTAAIVKSFTTGNLEATEEPTDFAINGKGFFKIKGSNGEDLYTKDGTFKLSVSDEGNKLVTSDGYYVQSDNGDIDLGTDYREINVTDDGTITVKRADGTNEEIGKLSMITFANPEGLEAVGKSLYKETDTSGKAYDTQNDGTGGTVMQGYLEYSNVQVVEEMVKLIQAQRAYEINSKSIQTADEMLGMANNLRR